MPSITAEEMMNSTIEELKNAIATDRQTVTNYEILQEIRNRYQEQQTKKMIEVTERVHCLTKKVFWLTVAVTLATIINLLIALKNFSV